MLTFTGKPTSCTTKELKKKSQNSLVLTRHFPFLMVPVTNSTTQGTGFALRIKMPGLEEERKPLCKNLNISSKVFFGTNSN